MASFATLHLTVGPGGLSLRASGRGSASAPLPALPEAGFQEDLACLALLPPHRDREQEERRQALRERLAQKGGPEALGRQVGQTLFGLLFPTDSFRRLYRRAREAGEGLRLVLEFVLEPPDAAVSRWSALPWEYLWDPEDRAFLASLPDFYLAGPGASPATGGRRPCGL